MRSEIVLRGVSIVCFVQRCSPRYLDKKYLGGQTFMKLFNHLNVCEVSSFCSTVFQVSRGRSFCLPDHRLSVARELVSLFSNSKMASGMETEALVAASDVSLETLKIDSSLVEDGSGSNVPKNLTFFPEHRLDVEPARIESTADIGDAFLHKGEIGTAASSGFIGKETDDPNDGRDQDVEFRVTAVTSATDGVCKTKTKVSDSVLESNARIADDSQRVNQRCDETLTASNLIGSDDLESKGSDCEKGASSSVPNRYAEKLLQFKAKLASNETVLPSELLRKVSKLAAKRHVKGDAKHLAVEYLDHPTVESVDGLRQPEGEWRHEMEAIFMSYFSEADGKSSSSKPRKEKKSREKMASDRPKRVKPSHFIAIQVTASEIHEKLAEIQKSVVARKRILEGALVNLPTLHITLMVLYLENNEEIERAKAALEVCKTRVLADGKDLAALPFAGIGDFGGNVVFAKVRDGPELDRLKAIAETVRKSFEEVELLSADPRGFQAHLTIMKLSKCPQLFRKGIRKINPDFYVDRKDDYFGSQSIKSLQLCTMKEKAENGYYLINHEVFFDLEVGSGRKDE